MHFEGTFEVKATAASVFDYLVDPRKVSGCLPGLQKLEVKSSDEYIAVVKAGVSFIKGELTMKFTVVEKNRPNHAKLLARGTGIGSSVDLETVMDLRETSPGTTSMKWRADAKIGGMIASVGSRLITGQAEKTIKQLFDCIQGKLESGHGG